MGLIYQSADQVLMWVGESELLPGPYSNTDMPVETFFSLMDVCARKEREDFIKALESTGFEFRDYLVNFHNFLGRPFWTRLWIVQETAANTHAIVLCGKNWIPWYDFLKAAQFFSLSLDTTKSSAIRVQLAHVSALKSCTKAFHDWKHGKEPDNGVAVAERMAFLLFTLNGQFACQDPRDRVFALANLATIADSALLKSKFMVDYSKSPGFVLAMVTLALIE
jgi:hypothetical protein